jgi:hypothetical protein
MQAVEPRDIHFDDMDSLGVLPEQFFGELRDSAAHEGERKLIMAVLEDATHCFQKYALATDRRGRESFRIAEEWFMDPEAGALLPFDYVCDALGLDSGSFRSGLRRWLDRQTGTLSTGRKVSVLRPRGASEQSGWNAQDALKKASGE